MSTLEQLYSQASKRAAENSLTYAGAFSPAEVLAIFLSVLITGQVAQDGETNWLEGAQLLAVYIILGIVFYFLPDVPATVRP